MTPTDQPGPYFLSTESPTAYRCQLQDLTAGWTDPGWRQDAFLAACDEVIELFTQGSDSLQPADTPYHDLHHTLQVTVCWARLAAGFRQHAPEGERPKGELLLLGAYAALYHDTGYLKPRGDAEGSGAKYSRVHERRSCAVADSQLHDDGLDPTARAVLHRLICATGTHSVIPAMPFASLPERRVAQMLASADFLAQMADPAYPAKLQSLFAEIREMELHRCLPRTDVAPSNPAELATATPAFWRDFVQPHLEGVCEAVYRYLAEPWPDGPNPYLQQVERNLAAVNERYGQKP